MNTPPFRPEQLTPKMSPMAYSLDDPSGNSGFGNMLSTPTKLKLDSGSTKVGLGASLLYPTTLSKLSDYSRSGRTKQRSNSESSRSVSPMRFQMFNNTPKMLRSEYLSQQPLLSTLMRSTGKSNKPAGTQKADLKIKSESKSQESTNASGNPIPAVSSSFTANLKMFGIKDILSQLQLDNQPSGINESATLSTGEQEKSNASVLDESVNQKESVTLKNSNEYQQQPETDKSKSNNNPRIPSHASSSTTKVNSVNEAPVELAIDTFPTDKNGFVQYETDKGLNTNRYSFISSTTTDCDVEWLEQQTAFQKPLHYGLAQTNNVSHHTPYHQIGGYSTSSNAMEYSRIEDESYMPSQKHHNTLSPHVENSFTSYENSSLDLKIKQLELEIGELRLQNEKLIHSINSSRLFEDRLMLEAIQEPSSNGPTQKSQRELERKLKSLERKFHDYRKLLRRLSDTQPKASSASQKRYSFDDLSKSSDLEKQLNHLAKAKSALEAKRISRISSTELRRIDDSSETSSVNSEKSDIDDRKSDTNNTKDDWLKEDDEIEYLDITDDEGENKLQLSKTRSKISTKSKTASLVSSEKSSRGGFSLNIPLRSVHD